MSQSIEQPTLLSDTILGTKRCRRCGISKSLDNFRGHPDCKDGLFSRCKFCENEQRRLRRASLSDEERKRVNASRKRAKQKYNQTERGRAKNKAHGEASRRRPWYREYLSSEKRKAYYRERLLRAKFNLSLEKYAAMVVQQNGGCAICGTLEEKAGRFGVFDVDHDHETGIVRGLLCSRCNRGIGVFSDNVELVRRAFEYLAKCLT